MKKQSIIILSLFFTICIGLLIYGRWADKKIGNKGPFIVNGYTPSEGSISERSGTKVYVKTQGSYFYPGDILTSKENGALMLWDSTMPKEWIVGVVTDSGTIEYKPFRIEPQ